MHRIKKIKFGDITKVNLPAVAASTREMIKGYCYLFENPYIDSTTAQPSKLYPQNKDSQLHYLK